MIERCLAGRREGWEEFLRRYAGIVESAVVRYLRVTGQPLRRDRVEELMQEVYCRLLAGSGRGLGSFRGSDHREVVVFLGRIARTVVVDLARAKEAAKRGGGTEIVGAEALAEIEDPSADPERRTLRRESLRLFLERCRDLLGKQSPGRDLDILRLALVEGWSSREIACSLPGSLSASAVDSVLYRLKKRLKIDGICLRRRGR